MFEPGCTALCFSCTMHITYCEWCFLCLLMFWCVLTQFSPAYVSRPLSSKWSAAPGRGESSARAHTHTHKRIVWYMCKLSQTHDLVVTLSWKKQTTNAVHNDIHQFPHLPSCSFPFACVEFRIATSCYVFVTTHMRTCVRVYVPVSSFLYGINVTCSMVPACVVYIYPFITSYSFSNTLLLLLSHQSPWVQRVGCRQPPCSVPVATWM